MSGRDGEQRDDAAHGLPIRHGSEKAPDWSGTRPTATGAQSTTMMATETETDLETPVTEDGPDTPRTVETRGGHTLAYTTYGPADGTPVLLLHGTPGSRLLGGILGPAATEHGVRLIAPDRPGYGRSPPWPDRTIGETASALAAVLEDTGVGRAGVLAFSGGAPYGLALAAAHPELVDRLALVSGATPTDVSTATPRTQRLLAGLATRTPRLLGGLLRGQAWLAGRLGPAVVLGQYTADPDAVPDATARTVAADLREALVRSRAGTVTELRHARTWTTPAAALAAPVTLHHGTADTNVPVGDARRLQAALPGASIEVHEGADHLGTLLEAGPAALAAVA